MAFRLSSVSDAISDTTLWEESAKTLPTDTDSGEENTEDSFTVDYATMIADSAYICTYPVATIMEAIREHFDDYINIDDNLNYVDIFYDQLKYSRKVALEDEAEVHRVEILEALENIHQKFLEEIKELFKSRLTITITDLEDDIPDDPDEIELIIRTIYDYFIIDARKNFKSVITKDVGLKLSTVHIEDDKIYFDKVNGMVDSYSPLIVTLTPEKFLRYSSSSTKDDVIALYNDGRITGNFLRKYTCKLYQNEDLKIEIVNDITMQHEFHNDILSAGNEEN